MKKNIIKLQAHVTEIPKEELKEQLGHLKKSELMRTIIMNEKEYGQCNYDRTLRNLWYSTVKLLWNHESGIEQVYSDCFQRGV